MSTSSSSADSPIPASSSSFSGSAPSHSSPPTPAPPAPPLLPLDWRETAQHWRDSVVNVRRAVMIALAAAVPPPNSPVSGSEDEGFSSDFPGSDSSEGEEEGYAHHPPVSPAGGPSTSSSSPEMRNTSSSAASDAFRLDGEYHPNSPATPPPSAQPLSHSPLSTSTTTSSPSPASSPAAAAVLEIRRILSSLLAEQRAVEYGVMHSMPPAPTDFSAPPIPWTSSSPFPRTPSPFPQNIPSSGLASSPPPPSSRPWTPRSPRSTQPRPSRRSRRCYRREHSRDSVRATARYYGTDLGAQHALDYALDRALRRGGRGGGYHHHQYDDEEDGDQDGDDEEEDEEDSSDDSDYDYDDDSRPRCHRRHRSRYHPSPPPSYRPLPRPARRLIYPLPVQVPAPHDYNDSVYDPRRRPPLYSDAPRGTGTGSDGQYMSDVFGPVVQRGRARLEGDVGSWECVEFASLSSSSSPASSSTSSEAGEGGSGESAVSGSGSGSPGLATPAFGGPVGLGYTHTPSTTRVHALATESWPFDTAPGDDAIPAYISAPVGLPVLAPRPVSFRHGGGWTTWGGGRHTTTTTSPCPSPSTSTSTSGSRSTSANNSPPPSRLPDSYSASLAAFYPPRFVAVAVAAAGHVSTPTHPRAPDQGLRHSSYSSLPLYPAPQTPVRARGRVGTPFPGLLARPGGWDEDEIGENGEDGADGEDEEENGEEMMRRPPTTSAEERRGYTSVLHAAGGRVVSPSRMGRMGRTTTTPTRRSRSRRDLIPSPPSRYLNASTDPGYPIHPRYPRHPRYTRHPSHATPAEEGRHTMLVGRRGESRPRPLAGGDGERVWWMRWDWRDL